MKDGSTRSLWSRGCRNKPCPSCSWRNRCSTQHVYCFFCETRTNRKYQICSIYSWALVVPTSYNSKYNSKNLHQVTAHVESDFRPSISKFNPIFRRTRWLTDCVCFGLGLRVSIEMSTRNYDICQDVSMQISADSKGRNGKRMLFISTWQNTSINIWISSLFHFRCIQKPHR